MAVPLCAVLDFEVDAVAGFRGTITPTVRLVVAPAPFVSLAFVPFAVPFAVFVPAAALIEAAGFNGTITPTVRLVVALAAFVLPAALTEAAPLRALGTIATLDILPTSATLAVFTALVDLETSVL